MSRTEEAAWDDAMGDCERSLGYGHSLIQNVRILDDAELLEYWATYTDAWEYGEGVGLCDPDAPWADPRFNGWRPGMPIPR